MPNRSARRPDLRSDLDFPVVVLGLSGAIMLLPAAHAAVNGEFVVARAFFYSAVILAVLTVLIALSTANLRPRVRPQRQLIYLLGTYAVLPTALALPMLQAVPQMTLWQAWFEMLSAFTTTGATLFAPEDLPDTVHLWRALIGWLGGFHFIVMALALLVPMNLIGIADTSARVSASGEDTSRQINQIADTGQRIRYYALMLLPAYGGLTLALWVGLLIAGDDGLVALCHAMSTLSTSGISPISGTERATSGVLGEVMIAVLLLVSVSRRVLPSIAGLERRFWRYDPEFLTASCILLISVTAVVVTHVAAPIVPIRIDQLASMIWGAFFTTLSFLTTTGFVSGGWDAATLWSGVTPPGLLLLALALIGGGVATTAGGVKLLRVYSVFRHGQRELELLIEPSSVGGRGTAARQLRTEGAQFAFIFFVLFAMMIGGVTAGLTLLAVDLESAIVLALAALTNAGPVTVILEDGMSVWANLTVGQQALLAAGMVLGRLEMLAVLTFLTPELWRR
jgi:trk system potassium uptake protein TrkH